MLERERGNNHQGPGGAGRLRPPDGVTHLHLQSTLWHVDSCEVSRSLAAREVALLVDDAAQGVEAPDRRQHLPGDRERLSSFLS